MNNKFKIDTNGQIKNSLGNNVSARAVYYPSLKNYNSFKNWINKISTKILNDKDKNIIKNHLYVILFDTQTSLDKGYLCNVSYDSSNFNIEIPKIKNTVPKDIFMITNLYSLLGDDNCLVNNI